MTDVRIRPYAFEDTHAVHEAVIESARELGPWMPWYYPGYCVEDSRIWIAEQIAAFARRTELAFAVVDPDGRYLGACGLNQIDRQNRRANLGYWIRTSAAGRGVATRAVESLRDWAFANTDLIRLEIVMATGNLASERVAQKAGALREGVLKARLLVRGTAHDAVMYAIVRA